MNPELISFLPIGEDSLKKFDVNAKDKRELIALINDSIYRRCAKTAKEKFEVLDLRDKVLKLVRFNSNPQPDSSSGGAGGSGGPNVSSTANLLVGTCTDMCPEKERYERDSLNLYNSFEMSPSLNNGSNEIDYLIMIKEYKRSSADQDLPLPNELRPLPVLYQTMLFLIDQVIPKIENSIYSALGSSESESDLSVGFWFDFIWNRTRSIRKDIIQQRLLLNNPLTSSSNSNENSNDDNNNNSNEEDDNDDNDNDDDDDDDDDELTESAVTIIEQSARFHIMCAHRLCDQDPEIFDVKINEETLKNCFQSLRQYYELTSTAASNLRPSNHEAEFRAYVILLNLTESNILSEVQRWPKAIRHTPQVRFALSVYFAFNSGNYIQFFRLVKSTDCDYLQACILHRHFYRMRSLAFRSIFGSYRELSQGNREKLYPLSKLQELLGFDDTDELLDYCRMYSLEVIDENYVHMRSTLTQSACFKITKESENKLRLRRSRALVESKFAYRLKTESDESLTSKRCLSYIISGITDSDVYVPSRFSERGQHVLQNSFDQDGFYTSDEIEEALIQAKQIYAANMAAINAAAAAAGQNQTSNVGVKPMIRRLKPKPDAAGPSANTAAIQKNNKRSHQTEASSTTTNRQAPGMRIPSLFGTDLTTKPKPAAPAAAGSSVNPFTGILQGSKQPQASFGFGSESLSKSAASLTTQPSSSSSSSLFGSSQFGSTAATTTTSSSSSSLFGGPKPSFQIDTSGGNKPIFTGLFGSGSNNQTENRLGASSSSLTTTAFGGISQGQQQQPIPSNNARKLDTIRREFGVPASAITTSIASVSSSSSSTNLDSHFEHIFESICLQLIRDFCKDFLISQRIIDAVCKTEIESLIQNVVAVDTKAIASQQLTQYRFEIEEHKRQIRKAHATEELAHEMFDYLVEAVMREQTRQFLYEQRFAERLIYDDVINRVFQTQFESILKQIALELNNEMLLDKLSEAVYFSSSSLSSSSFEYTDESFFLPDTHNSIFMNDLHSFLHACVFEFTRLNLSVNRELYYELKQALDLNRSIYLFRKWRLRLSLRLLRKAYKSVSSVSSSGGSSSSGGGSGSNSTSPLITKQNSSRELNCYSLMSSYGASLLSNLSVFHALESILLPRASENYSENNSKQELSSPGHVILHSKEFLAHVARNLPLSTRHYLFNILYDNYFNIIHNRHADVVLPLAIGTELNAKTVFACASPTETTSRRHGQLINWLLFKLFGDALPSEKFGQVEDLKLVESFGLSSLDETKYGVNYVLRASKTRLARDEIEMSARNRCLFGADSMIFVMEPLESDVNINSYTVANRDQFQTIMRLCNNNIKKVLFISFISNRSITESIIEFMIGGGSNNNNNQLKYSYFQINDDMTSYDDTSLLANINSTLTNTYQTFLLDVYRSQIANSERIRAELAVSQVSSLSDIVYMTLVKFLEVAASHQQATSSGVHIPFRCVLNEYNERVRRLVEMLSLDEYRRMWSWPIPELVKDRDENASYWTLKYWNTDECFDQIIRRQFYQLICLDEIAGFNFDEQNLNDSVELKSIETHIFEYLSKLIDQKNASHSQQLDNGFKSTYQLENAIRIALESLKKQCTSNFASASTVSSLTTRKKETKLLVAKSSINWPNLLLPIANFLVSNGTLSFRGKHSIYLDQFYVFNDAVRIGSYDWVNNCESCGEVNATRSSLVDKYSRLQTMSAAAKTNGVKRRFDGACEPPPCPNLHVELVDQIDKSSAGEITNTNTNTNTNKARKVSDVEKPATAQLEMQVNQKFDTFISLLKNEKENSNLWKTRLDNIITERERQPSMIMNSVDRTSDENDRLTSSNIASSFEMFFSQLNEEKSKNEKFNQKLLNLISNS